MKKQYIAILLILIISLAAAGYKLYLNKEDGITATGTIEITLADIVPKLNGYIEELNIQVGDVVEAGQTVARIKRPDLQAQLLADKAALARAKTQLADLEKGSRNQEILQATADVAAAQAVFNKAKNDLARSQTLYGQGAISAQELDAAQSNYDVAENSLVAAQMRQSLTAEGNRPDVIEAQRLEVKRLEAAVEATESSLADIVITSPLSGIILTKNFEQGEYAGIGSAIATVGDMSDCWLKIYISSAQLGLIKVGQRVDVRIDSHADRVFAGTIKEISQKAEFTPRQSITQNERANLVFYVKVKINNEEGILKPGMPADVVIK